VEETYYLAIIKLLKKDSKISTSLPLNERDDNAVRYRTLNARLINAGLKVCNVH